MIQTCVLRPSGSAMRLKAFACFKAMFTHYSGPAPLVGPALYSFYGLPWAVVWTGLELGSDQQIGIMNYECVVNKKNVQKERQSRRGKWVWVSVWVWVWVRHANRWTEVGWNANAFLVALDWIFSQHSNDAAAPRTQTIWSNELKQSRKAQSGGQEREVAWLAHKIGAEASGNAAGKRKPPRSIKQPGNGDRLLLDRLPLKYLTLFANCAPTS